MKNKLSVIRDNLLLASSSKKLADAIVASQREEIVIALGTGSVSFEEAAEIFSQTFDSPLLSAEFLSFCIELSNSGKLIGCDSFNFLNNGKISCMQNEYSDAALKLLGEKLRLEKEFESDFASVCEAVYSKRCDYALLPLYNTRDGLIVSLYKLVQRYDLHIFASVRVLMADGNTETEFFVVSDKPQYYEKPISRILLSVTHFSDDTVSHLLSAFSENGIIVKYINTLPIQYTDDKTESVMILDVSAVPVLSVKCFIEAALPYSTTVGVYSIVK